VDLCARCASEPLRIDGIRSVALFEGTLRQAIHRFKYRFGRDLAAPLGEMIVDYWRQHPLSADLIVPVPLHARRLKERGYNQAQLLADQLGRAVGIAVASEALRRTRYTMAQAKLDGRHRRQNVQGAFLCQDSRVRDRAVLLIDDICTTGATLEACSVALREGGASSVWALTLARTPQKLNPAMAAI
jgi:ComF family protein